MPTLLTIGQLSAASGVSIRALRHYDDIGLLVPSRRSEGNYRLYDKSDVQRLLQIRSLQSLGLSLDQIGKAMIGGGPTLAEVLEQQLHSTEAQIDELRRLRSRLAGLIRTVEDHGAAASEDILKLIREMTMVEKYYTDEQLRTLAQRADALGEEGMRAAEARWTDLIDRVRKAKAAGLAPASPEVRAMAAEWQELIDAFTGGDPGIRQSLDQVWRQEDQVAGFDAAEMGELIAYLHSVPGE